MLQKVTDKGMIPIEQDVKDFNCRCTVLNYHLQYSVRGSDRAVHDM